MSGFCPQSAQHWEKTKPNRYARSRSRSLLFVVLKVSDHSARFLFALILAKPKQIEPETENEHYKILDIGPATTVLHTI